MIRKQRKTKYAGIEESDIPLIDFFRIGDYRKVNLGYTYCIRNSGSDSFVFVKRKQIVADAKMIEEEAKNANRKDSSTTDSNSTREDGKQGVDRSSDRYFGDRHELLENDQGDVYTEEPERDLHSGKGNFNSGSGLSRKIPVGESARQRQAAKETLALQREALRDQEVVGGKLSYLPVSNNEVTQKAIDYITEEGWEAANAGDERTWLDVLHNFQYMNTNSGAKFFQKSLDKNSLTCYNAKAVCNRGHNMGV